MSCRTARLLLATAARMRGADSQNGRVASAGTATTRAGWPGSDQHHLHVPVAQCIAVFAWRGGVGDDQVDVFDRGDA